MLKFICILAFSLTAFSVVAEAKGRCTEWTQQTGVSCVMLGEFANVYKRQCENPCWQGPYGQGNMGPGCDMESLCSITDPSTFKGPCSDWYADEGSTCYDPNAQSWEQHWVRSCTVGLKESWCSREKPAF